MISQFDTGPDALVSQVYGKGQDPFGTPALSLGRVVFGDGSVNAAQAAEADLASPTYQDCWARTTDTLSARQGLVVPVHPSTVLVPDLS